MVPGYTLPSSKLSVEVLSRLITLLFILTNDAPLSHPQKWLFLEKQSNLSVSCGS